MCWPGPGAGCEGVPPGQRDARRTARRAPVRGGGLGLSHDLVRCPVHPSIWWTFAGSRANAALAVALTDVIDPAAQVSGLRLRLRPDASVEQLRMTITSNHDRLIQAEPVVDGQAVDALKFSTAIPAAGSARRRDARSAVRHTMMRWAHRGQSAACPISCRSGRSGQSPWSVTTCWQASQVQG